MPINTQLRLGQITGSFGAGAKQIKDSEVATAATSINVGDLSGSLSHIVSAIKRIHGAATFSSNNTGEFTKDIVPATASGQSLGNADAEFGGLYLGDNRSIYFGSDQDVGAGFETTDNSLMLSASEGSALKVGFAADEGDDAADRWQMQFADGGNFTFASKISNSYVDHLAVTPNATVANSTVSGKGNIEATTAFLPANTGGTTLGTASKEMGDIFIADDRPIQFGSDQDVRVSYSTGEAALAFSGSTNGGDLALMFHADGPSPDNIDQWKLKFTDGGTLKFENKAGGSYASYLELIPHGTVLTSSIVAKGNFQVDGDLTVNGTTMTVNTTNVFVEDRIIGLNSGSHDASGDVDQGILFSRSSANLGEGGDKENMALLAVGSGTGNIFKLGATNNDATDNNLTIAADDLGDLHINTATFRADADRLHSAQHGGGNNVRLELSGSKNLSLYATREVNVHAEMDLVLSASRQMEFRANDAGSTGNAFVFRNADTSNNAVGAIHYANAGGDATFLLKGINDSPLQLEAAGQAVIVGYTNGTQLQFVNGHDGNNFGVVTGSAAGLIISSSNENGNDILFHTNEAGQAAPQEIARFDGSAKSLLFAGNNSIHFSDSNNFIQKNSGNNIVLQSNEQMLFVAKDNTGSGNDANIAFKFRTDRTEAIAFASDYNTDGDIHYLNFNPAVVANTALTIGESGIGFKHNNGTMQFKNESGDWKSFISSDDISGLGSARKPVSGSLAAARTRLTTLSSDAQFATFDIREEAHNLSPADEKEKIDVYVNGQLLLSGTLANIGAGSHDYTLHFASEDRGACDLKFGFDLEKDDTVNVIVR